MSLGFVAKVCLLGMWLMMMPFTSVKAHPHAWIDLKVSVLFDDTGKVKGLRQYWLLDPLYSMILLEEMREDAQGDTLREKLDDIGGRMISNLEPYAYFTQATYQGEVIRDVKIDNHLLSVERSRLQLGFDLLFPEVVSITTNTPLHYSIFDPTYYIEILHEEVEDAIVLNTAQLSCQFNLKPPNPSPALIARAAALDINETSDPDLGKHFAEKVEIRCE